MEEARRRLGEILAGDHPSPDSLVDFARRVRTAIVTDYLAADPRLRACARVLRGDATTEAAYVDLLDLLVPDAVGGDTAVAASGAE